GRGRRASGGCDLPEGPAGPDHAPARRRQKHRRHEGQPVMISDATISTWWVWARAKYGFDDKQIRKYTFNSAPFLTDQNAIQQGYVSSEPYLIAKEGKFTPQVFLLSDAGYPGYANFILARGKDVRERPEIVQAFVNASIDGWKSYLTGDPAP